VFKCLSEEVEAESEFRTTNAPFRLRPDQTDEIDETDEIDQIHARLRRMIRRQQPMMFSGV